MNIVTIISSLLTPAVVGRIATALGIDPRLAQMAVTAALPAILAAISRKVAQPAGAGLLTGLLGQQSLVEAIETLDAATLRNRGMSQLHTLFGQAPVEALSSAIGKFTGVPQSASAAVLGSITPLVLGSLAKEQRTASIDGTDLTALLAGQKDNIAAAMPKGFAELLAATGLLGAAPEVAVAAQPATASSANVARPATVEPAPAQEATTAPSAASVATAEHGAGAPAPSIVPVKTDPSPAITPTVTTAAAPKPLASAAVRAEPAATAPKTPVPPPSAVMPPRATPQLGPAQVGGNLRRWLPVLAGALLVLAAWQIVAKRGSDAGVSLVYNNVDIGKRMAGIYAGLKTTVGNIRDEATASANLPKLRGYSSALLDLRETAEKMPASGRKDLGALVTPMLPGLDALVTTAIKAPGAETIVRPVLEQISERMRMLAKG